MTVRVLTRLPLRVRLTAAFAAAMAVVLVAFGLFLAEQLERNLTRTIDQGLETRADQLAGEGPDGEIGSGNADAERGDGVAQILSPAGTVLATTAGLTVPLLSPQRTQTLTANHRIVVLPRTEVSDDQTRVLAYRTTFNGTPIVVAVGASVEPLRDARDQLVGLLLIGGPLALLFASGLGYAVAAAALRPVERMRSQAQAVTADDPERLTVPPASDELQALAVTLNGMLDRLQDALEHERAFTTNASHELRTPLAVLKAELEVALRPQRTREEHVQALRSASEETDRLTRLADDLLVLARAHSNGLPIRRTTVNVADLLERVTKRFSELGAQHGAVIDWSAPHDLSVHADEERLEQAVSNLVVNAAKHGASMVVASAARSDDGVTIAVRDDGDGFPAAFLPHAFERFTQADASRHHAGAGLGLAIVQAIAHAHGGDVDARNVTPTGACVSITLPDRAEDSGCAS